MPPCPKRWRRVEIASGSNRNSNGTWSSVVGVAFKFDSLSYRSASVTFSTPVDRVVIRTRNSAFPAQVSGSGFGWSSSDMRSLNSPLVIAPGARQAGSLSFGAGGTGSGAFWFDEIYGEVYE